MLFLIWSAVFIIAVVLYFRNVYSRFSKHGVKHFKPVPILGNMTNVLLKRTHLTTEYKRQYKAFPEERFIGIYEFITPSILVTDVDLVKDITVKDFEYFLDHRKTMDENVDPFFGRSLVSLKGQEWKDMRSTLSPAFTSSKMRLMVPFMVEVGDQMIQSLKDKIKKLGVGYTDVEANDLMTRYANDVIASCAFGLKVDSYMKEDNEFYKKGKEASTFKFYQLIKLLGYISFPKIMSIMKIKLFAKETTHYFKNLVHGTMKNREERNIFRPDMIHLLMEAKKGKLIFDDKTAKEADTGFAIVEESSIGKKNVHRDWSDNDLTAQALLFFIAGFETVSTVMTLLLHEIAVNPDVQEKLVQEIKENDIKNNGKFNYKSIQEMTYMDMVVSEILRMWPAVIALSRMCIKDYNLGKPNSKSTKDYIIRKGEGILIPVWNFHHDPKFFPNPSKFDPERFSEENKHKIHPYAYMPFGMGPRNCIGSRFALYAVKVMLYQLLKHMVITPNEKTCVPAELSLDSFNVRIKGGHWIRLKPRT